MNPARSGRHKKTELDTFCSIKNSDHLQNSRALFLSCGAPETTDFEKKHTFFALRYGSQRQGSGGANLV